MIIERADIILHLLQFYISRFTNMRIEINLKQNRCLLHVNIHITHVLNYISHERSQREKA
jgi:hypothetical protein